MSLTKNMAYDHPAYTSRNVSWLSTIAAGGAGSGVATAQKFVAYANTLLMGLTCYTTTIGSSTFTTGLANSTPAATTSVKGTQLSAYRVFNTAASGATIALATTTYGPYTVAGGFVTSGTATVQAGCFDSFQLAGQGTATNSVLHSVWN
jgi:hypothetical protein